MVFVKANYVTVLDPRQKKGKNKIVCKFRTGRKRIDHNGKLLYTYDDFYGEFIVEAYESAKLLKNRDKINIKKAIILIEGQHSRIKVFEFEMAKYQNLSNEAELKYIDKITNDEHLKFF